ncbi:Low affinity iron permease [Aureobasidium melanogenum CBS 110374]|uniref:Low affinity iron permease n=1 Tax=Aureobasidium melanogenum (strain CBS 110374) TaxID=1043003 RepID=A0A074W3R5_AURM1|nr:Low affinity iron permease [Aureobasidium melanogenum CBS 110374]KEQ66149.1 Low affinity iron permease [Aureobasidium melanogenum CBS 110374]
MNRLMSFLSSFGARRELRVKATYISPKFFLSIQHSSEKASPLVQTDSASSTEKKLLDRWLDQVVSFSGSGIATFLILACLLTWALLGIRYSQISAWQVGISDVQSVLSLIFDALLVRQQLNSHNDALTVTLASAARTRAKSRSEVGSLPETELPSESRLARWCRYLVHCLGHVVTVGLFWIGIIIWLAFGHYCGWSNEWFFYINTGTAALLIFGLSFIAYNREQHNKYMQKCLGLIDLADEQLEYSLRTLTADDIDHEISVIPAPHITKLQRCIDFYADLVGTLSGIAILAFTLVLWAVLGPLMHFDASWWLLLGTYTGLVGMNDGCVLRNLCFDRSRLEDHLFQEQCATDQHLLRLAGLTNFTPEPSEEDVDHMSRISAGIGHVFSHEISVLLFLISIIIMIIAASILRWNELGQLICNVPPMIIESFFTLILITGIDTANQQRRRTIYRIYQTRLTLIWSCSVLSQT